MTQGFQLCTFLENNTMMLLYLIWWGTVESGLRIFYPANWRMKTSDDVSGSNNVSSSMSQIILKVEYLRENYKYNTTSVPLYLWKHLHGQSGKNRSVLLGKCLGWFCFICTYTLLCFNAASKLYIQLFTFHP